jgi:hypothetical protein
MYHLGDEQNACWWPQFRDIVSPHRHEQHEHANKKTVLEVNTEKTQYTFMSITILQDKVII